jgi:hypothetical protein
MALPPTISGIESYGDYRDAEIPEEKKSLLTRSPHVRIACTWRGGSSLQVE